MRAGVDPDRARRGTLRVVPLHGRPAGSGSADPHQRRDARQQLPAVADRVRRDLGHRRALAGLPHARSARSHRGLPEARSPLRRHPDSPVEVAESPAKPAQLPHPSARQALCTRDRRTPDRRQSSPSCWPPIGGDGRRSWSCSRRARRAGSWRSLAPRRSARAVPTRRSSAWPRPSWRWPFAGTAWRAAHDRGDALVVVLTRSSSRPAP